MNWYITVTCNIYVLLSLLIGNIWVIWEAGHVVMGDWTKSDVIAAILTFIMVALTWPLMLLTWSVFKTKNYYDKKKMVASRVIAGDESL